MHRTTHIAAMDAKTFRPQPSSTGARRTGFVRKLTLISPSTILLLRAMQRNPPPIANFVSPRALTPLPPHRYTTCMAQTFLIFDFGTDEEGAQKARHRIEGWKQAFKLDRKMLVRFEREAAEVAEASAGAKKSGAPAASKSKKQPEPPEAPAETGARIRLLVRLDFSDHEKLSHQRWLDRIPGEEPFAVAKLEIVGQGHADLDATAKRFEDLEAQPGPPRAR
jgi:hypothetical protein